MSTFTFKPILDNLKCTALVLLVNFFLFSPKIGDVFRTGDQKQRASKRKIVYFKEKTETLIYFYRVAIG